MTVSMIQAEVGMSHASVTAMLADTNPVLTVGRTKLYQRKAVWDLVYERNQQVLGFLGFPVNPSESYDLIVTPAVSDDAAEGQE